ncbi:hypothetical protein ACFL0W_05820 [Nanoarchaeota archaeon]
MSNNSMADLDELLKQRYGSGFVEVCLGDLERIRYLGFSSDQVSWIISSGSIDDVLEVVDWTSNDRSKETKADEFFQVYENQLNAVAFEDFVVSDSNNGINSTEDPTQNKYSIANMFNRVRNWFSERTFLQVIRDSPITPYLVAGTAGLAFLAFSSADDVFAEDSSVHSDLKLVFPNISDKIASNARIADVSSEGLLAYYIPVHEICLENNSEKPCILNYVMLYDINNGKSIDLKKLGFVQSVKFSADGSKLVYEVCDKKLPDPGTFRFNYVSGGKPGSLVDLKKEVIRHLEQCFEADGYCAKKGMKKGDLFKFRIHRTGLLFSPDFDEALTYFDRKLDKGVEGGEVHFVISDGSISLKNRIGLYEDKFSITSALRTDHREFNYIFFEPSSSQGAILYNIGESGAHLQVKNGDDDRYNLSCSKMPVFAFSQDYNLFASFCPTDNLPLLTFIDLEAKKSGTINLHERGIINPIDEFALSSNLLVLHSPLGIHALSTEKLRQEAFERNEESPIVIELPPVSFDYCNTESNRHVCLTEGKFCEQIYSFHSSGKGISFRSIEETEPCIPNECNREIDCVYTLSLEYILNDQGGLASVKFNKAKRLGDKYIKLEKTKKGNIIISDKRNAQIISVCDKNDLIFGCRSAYNTSSWGSSVFSIFSERLEPSDVDGLLLSEVVVTPDSPEFSFYKTRFEEIMKIYGGLQPPSEAEVQLPAQQAKTAEVKYIGRIYQFKSIGNGNYKAEVYAPLPGEEGNYYIGTVSGNPEEILCNLNGICPTTKQLKRVNRIIREQLGK